MAAQASVWVLAVALMLGASGLEAQTPGAGLDLGKAMAAAVAHYPSVIAAQQAATMAASQADLAQTAFLPNAGLAAQWDRGTDNATLGLSFASPLPGISGTVPVSDYSQRSAWTSAAGLYFSWEIADFGRRAANVRYFRELAQAAGDQTSVVKLQVGAHAADAYLNVLAAQQQLRVTTADVTRWADLAKIVDALVDQQLRPGADRSRAQAELAAARIRASNATRDLDVARASLAEALGVTPGQPLPPLEALPAALPEAPAATSITPPQLLVRRDTVAAAQAQQKEIARSALPRWYALGSAYGRGSGVLSAGHLADGLAGLGPTTAANWAVGIGLDFSFTRWRAQRVQSAAAKAQLAQEQARQRQVEQQWHLVQQKAAADWSAARMVAQESPIGLAAAKAGEAQARVRYQTGLASLVDLANAEQLLTQADSDNAIGQLQVWRALVETAFASGDLQPVLRAAQGK